MSESLFIFLAEGVAGDAATKRRGARHALMIFVPASNWEAAETTAATKAAERGWHFVRLKRGKETTEDIDDISDDMLRNAAQSARDIGFGMVIYRDEIMPNA
jgi:hypothetical protein